MIEIKKVKQFITSEFEVATLSGRIKDGKLCTGLTLKGGLNSKYETISTYGIDIKEKRKDEIDMANYLLDYFLSNKIIEVKYNCSIPHYKCSGIRIESDRQTLYIAFESSLKTIFPKLLSRIEQAKGEGVLKLFIENIDNIKELSMTSYSQLHSGINSISSKFRYSVLNERDKEGEKVIYPKDILLIRSLIKEFISSINFNYYNPIDYLLSSLESSMKYVQNGYWVRPKYYLLNIGNKQFYTEDEQILEIYRQVLIELKPLYEISTSKQLVMKI